METTKPHIRELKTLFNYNIGYFSYKTAVDMLYSYDEQFNSYDEQFKSNDVEWFKMLLNLVLKSETTHRVNAS